MKYILLAIFVYFFVAMPMHLLETAVVPQLNQLTNLYSTAEAKANAVANSID
jgi:hypothetical protein